jgi:hypothetical protein
MKTVYDIQKLITESCFLSREVTECQEVGPAAWGVCCDMHTIADDMIMKGEY